MRKILLSFLILLGCQIKAQLPANLPTNGLVAYYPFSGNANDVSGNNYNGSVYGAALTIGRSGQANSAYSFDGAGSYIDAIISTIPQNASARTITGWFKSNSPNFNDTNNSCIFNYGSLSTAQRFSLCLYSKGYLECITGSDFGNGDVTVQNNYFTNDWYFFALTYDGTKVSLYINGKYFAAATQSLNTINKTFRIGRRVTGDSKNEYFKGSIDDIGIWNRVLTPAEISDLFIADKLVTISPASSTFCKEGSVQLTSVVTYSGNVTYQWMKDEVVIPNAVSSNYTAASAGNYTLKIKNSEGSVVATSNVATVSTTPAPIAGSQTLQAGATVADLVASGGTIITWYKDATGGSPLALSTPLQTGKYYVSTMIQECESARTAVDVTVSPTPVNYTLIPDLNFENRLIALGIDSGSPDGKVLTSSISTVTTLDVSNKQIANLTGIENFAALTNLDCYQNQLTSLDISKNTSLTYVRCFMNNLTSFSVGASTSLKRIECQLNKLTNLDVTKLTALENLDVHSNLLTNLDLSKNLGLKYLLCLDNALITLDVSSNTELISFYCYTNKLTNLDVSKNIKLSDLRCQSNQLISLDLSQNINLRSLNCNSNKLFNLNLKNGKNTSLSTLDLKSNPNLSCIQVDNVTYSNTNWSTFKDATANYNSSCPVYLAISSSFEDKLIALGIDTDGKNGKISQSSIENVNTIDVSNSNITDLSGIENFTSLEKLICKSNQITTLDVSKNTALKYLDCSENPLTFLDLTKNTQLTELYCDGIVQITKKSTIANGSLTNLDVSKNTMLIKLSCSNNKLSSLDLSQNIALNSINCSANQLTNLNLKNGHNTAILNLNIKNNGSLSCILVDNKIYSDTNWSAYKDLTATYNTICSALGITESVFDVISIHPNPTKGELHIDNISLEKVLVYNSMGQIVKTITFDPDTKNNDTDLTGLPTGIYYLLLKSKDFNSTKKIILE